MKTSEIPAASNWLTNGLLIADVARLGYIGEWVLDATYGQGVFWSDFQPKRLWANDPFVGIGDVDPGAWNRPERWYTLDAAELPEDWADLFDTTVFDPPYKLNGRPDEKADRRYGVHMAATLAERKALIIDGSQEAVRVTKPGGTILVKCMNQVASGKMQWQTDWVTNAVVGASKVAMLHMLTHPRSQAHRGPQKHPRSNYSTLLVFRKAPP